ncbi:MAG: MFS family permease, partial [Candidatus Marinamargulisbacteria bacterium]
YFAYTEQDNSLIFLYMGVLALIIQGSITRRAPKNLKRATVFGIMAVSLSFILLGIFPTIFLDFFALAVMAVGIGFVNAYLPSLLSVHSDPEKQGSIMGVYESLGSLSRILGPLIAYSTIYHSLKAGYLIFGLILCVIGLWFATFFRQRLGKA